MNTSFINNNLIIHSQIVKNIIYSENLDENFNISECDIDFNILRHKELERDFKVQMLLQVTNFKIFVEGHYEVSTDLKDENIDEFIQINGLATLIPFLRYSIFTITSTTKEKGIHLPLISLEKLVNNQVEKNKKRKKESKK